MKDKTAYTRIAMLIAMTALILWSFLPQQSHAKETVLVGIDKVEDVLADVLAEQTSADGIMLEGLRIKLSGDARYYLLQEGLSKLKEPTLVLDSVEVNSSGRFVAYGKEYVPEGDSRQVIIHGRFKEAIEIPVAAHTLREGHLVTEADISYALLEQRKIRRQVLTHEKDLIGKEVSRVIRKGTPFTTQVLTRPTAFERGDLVTLSYQNKRVELSTVAEALENATVGQIVALKNTDSGRLVRAMATEKGLAIVNYKDLVIKGEQHASR